MFANFTLRPSAPMRLDGPLKVSVRVFKVVCLGRFSIALDPNGEGLRPFTTIALLDTIEANVEPVRRGFSFGRFRAIEIALC